jgi:hypothetical protein
MELKRLALQESLDRLTEEAERLALGARTGSASGSQTGDTR